MGYAFISYSSKNQASADAMRELFNKHNIDTWMAPYDIPAGSEYAEVLYGAIEGCSCLVLMLTDVSQNSQWVKKEVNIAITNGRMIIPVKLEDVELNDVMKVYLNDRQIVAVHKIDEDSREIRKVIDAVRVCTKSNKEERETNSLLKLEDGYDALIEEYCRTPKRKYFGLLLGEPAEKFVGRRVDGRYEIKEIINEKSGVFIYKAYDNIDCRYVNFYVFSDVYYLKWKKRKLTKKKIKKEILQIIPKLKYDDRCLVVGDNIVYMIRSCDALSDHARVDYFLGRMV